MLFEGTWFSGNYILCGVQIEILLLKAHVNVNVVELEDAMSVEGVHPEITGDRPCDGLRVDLKRCLLKVSTLFAFEMCFRC